MRVLITTPAGLGHIHPMVPLARALVDRGHTVRWALPEQVAYPVVKAGIDVVAIRGRELYTPDVVMRRYPELSDLSPAERPEVMFGKLFGALSAPPMLDGLEAAIPEWRPDLVVSDAAEFAGHILAASLGIPSVTKGFGPLLPASRVASAGREVEPLWLERGLDAPTFGGAYDHLYIDPYPSELQQHDGSHIRRRQPMRPGAEDAGAVPGREVPLPAARDDAPLVYVTMGTVFNTLDGGLARPLEAAAALNVRVLATVGPDGDVDALGPQPPQIRVERYVPQAAVLPLCSAVVSHAGSGTVLGTLQHGLPQLCLPRGADQFLNAAAVAGAGAAISVEPSGATVDAIRDALEAVMNEPSYRQSAQQLADSIAAMPSPEEVVPVLEGIA